MNILHYLCLYATFHSRVIFEQSCRRCALPCRTLPFSVTQANEGWEALRAIYAEYRPKTISAGHMQIVTIITPKLWLKPHHVSRPFYDVLVDWEKVIADYELATAETISNALKCATVSQHGPVHVQRLLMASAKDVRHDYNEMRLAMQENTSELAESYYL